MQHFTRQSYAQRYKWGFTHVYIWEHSWGYSNCFTSSFCVDQIKKTEIISKIKHAVTGHFVESLKKRKGEFD